MALLLASIPTPARPYAYLYGDTAATPINALDAAAKVRKATRAERNRRRG